MNHASALYSLMPDLDDGKNKKRRSLQEFPGEISGANIDRVLRLIINIFKVPLTMIWTQDEERGCRTYPPSNVISSWSTSFFEQTIHSTEGLTVENAAHDMRFSEDSMVMGLPYIRFYAGVPLRLASGERLGVLCIVDRMPRRFDKTQLMLLAELATLAVSQFGCSRALDRADEVVHLSDHTQMIDDLQEETLLCPGRRRTMLLLEVLDQTAMRESVRATGLPPNTMLLRNLSSKLRKHLKPVFNIYALGAGWLALIINVKKGEIEIFIQDLLHILESPIESAGFLIDFEVLIGRVDFNLNDDEISDAFRKAMTTVYRAATLGVPLLTYDPQFDIRHQRAHAILRDIPNAIAKNEFFLVFQPKLRISTGKFEGVEALIRWQHPHLGDISPTEFIPLAENTTLIHEITHWVVNSSLGQLKKWHDQGFPISVAVNVSARNLEHEHFLSELANACTSYAVAADMLHIECTEYSGLTAPKTLMTLNEIRSYGMQLSLDDFGTGYSNLTCLEKLPFQVLKIDKSLIISVNKSVRAKKLLEGIVGLGHTMGFRLIAEGVETADVFSAVTALGFDHAQGYYLSKPLLPDALIEFLRNPPTLLISESDAQLLH